MELYASNNHSFAVEESEDESEYRPLEADPHGELKDDSTREEAH